MRGTANSIPGNVLAKDERIGFCVCYDGSCNFCQSTTYCPKCNILQHNSECRACGSPLKTIDKESN